MLGLLGIGVALTPVLARAWRRSRASSCWASCTRPSRRGGVPQLRSSTSTWCTRSSHPRPPVRGSVRIFRRDLLRLGHRPSRLDRHHRYGIFVPALYAWFNIVGVLGLTLIQSRRSAWPWPTRMRRRSDGLGTVNVGALLLVEDYCHGRRPGQRNSPHRRCPLDFSEDLDRGLPWPRPRSSRPPGGLSRSRSPACRSWSTSSLRSEVTYLEGDAVRRLAGTLDGFSSGYPAFCPRRDVLSSPPDGGSCSGVRTVNTCSRFGLPGRDVRGRVALSRGLRRQWGSRSR